LRPRFGEYASQCAGRRDTGRDNVFVERLWRTIKYEDDARASIGRYLPFYNERRQHASLDGMTPDQANFTLPPFRSAA
jgi:putative transposase